MFVVGLPTLTAQTQRPMADTGVRQIVSLEMPGYAFRAIKGYEEGYPYLVIEKIQLPERESEKPSLAKVWNVREMIGGKKFEHAFEGDEIDGLVWRRRALEFVHTDRLGKERCLVSGLIEMRPSVSCQSLK